MCDGEYGAAVELLPDCGLDEVVRLQVHRGGRLVQHQDLGLSCGDKCEFMRLGNRAHLAAL